MVSRTLRERTVGICVVLSGFLDGVGLLGI